MTDAGIPVVVHPAGQRVVCVGAGPVAAAKVERFVDAGALVEVVAPEAEESIRRAADEGRLTWRQRVYRVGDLTGAVLVIAATATVAVNSQVSADAAAQATLCVRVDRDPAGQRSTATLPASVRRGPLLLTVSTGGGAPALSRRIRSDLAGRYGPEYGTLAILLAELRSDPTIRAALAALPAAERRARWRSVLDTDILNLIRKGHLTNAKEVAAACLSSLSD